VESAGSSYYKLARLVVLKEYRHYKFGRNLVLTLHDWVKDHARNSGVIDTVKIVCHSQAVRADSAGVVAFYRKFGYEEEVMVISARLYDVTHAICPLTLIRAICLMKTVNPIRRWSHDYH
jgi:GNAT superfamily N-acetyltransferase